jgi:serine/threonine protein kinase
VGARRIPRPAPGALIAQKATAMIELGQTVGNYRITSKLGEGGMGAVYLAEHPVIGRKAALKVIHPQHARNHDVVARFVNEASAISRIGHEHIVEVTDFGRTDGGDFYFIMEYLEGQALSDLIALQAPFEPARALAIAAQIADALVASHAHGVIHRDLKPDNVFVVPREDDANFVKVLDFGLAKLTNDNAAAPYETRAGLVMGTPYYMSPEQCEGSRELDERADIYSLGVVLFEMLTGHLPFGGDGYAEVLMKQVTMQAPAARSLVPDLPEELDVLLARALAKQPDERFPTMEAFREALREPAASAAALPRLAIRDDLSARMKAAHPMSRAEIVRRRSAPQAPPTRLGAGVGPQNEKGENDEHDDEAEAVPPRSGLRNVALVAATAFASLALAAGLTYGRAVQQTAAASAPLPSTTVVVTFGSDPDGASVVAADGTKLGTTPLAIQVARSNRAAAYRFEKAGFEAKTMESIANVASSMFVLLKPLGPAPEAGPSSIAARAEDDPPSASRGDAPARHHRTKRAMDPDGDGILAPSFERH